jgi:hypothetical protein
MYITKCRNEHVEVDRDYWLRVKSNVKYIFILKIMTDLVTSSNTETRNKGHIWSKNFSTVTLHCEPGSSVSIVSGCGLDDRAIEVRSLAEAKDFFSSLCVQTGSGAHPASWPMSTLGPFLGDKARPKRDTDHSPPSSAKVENE